CGCRAAEKADELASFHGNPEAKTANGINTHVYRGRGWDVRFGSKADMCTAPAHVCFTPNSDRESRHPQTVMSALPPEADMCSATSDVRFGPKADIGHLFYSITSSARPSSEIGTVRPSALAVLRLMISSTFVACCTGRSAGSSPLRIRP